jgi:energy-coupling factor transporter transmembrane protein EcfT
MRCNLTLVAKRTPIQGPSIRDFRHYDGNNRHVIALGASGKQQAQPASPGQSKAAKVMSTLLSMSSVPYSSYVPQPRTFLHYMMPEIKMLWLVGILFVMAKASSSSFRLGFTGIIMLVTMLTFPRRLWKPQLLRVLAVSSLIFVFTACGSDGVAPVLSGGRAPGMDDLPGTLAASSDIVPKYRYTVLNLGIFSITKRSFALAVTLFSLTCITLQTASMCLVTTPPERMAAALETAMAPLRLFGAPVHKIYIMLLLSLRFLSTVFEEMRNLILGLASRGIDWSQLGGLGTLNIVLKTGTALFKRLFKRSETIATAMVARGFSNASDHRVFTLSAADADTDADDSGVPRQGFHLFVNAVSLFAFIACLITAMKLS